MIFREPQYSGGPLPAALRKIESWLTEHGWELEWSRREDDHVNFTQRKIVVNHNRTPQSQIFGILHEMGHIMLSESPEYILRFPASDDFKHRCERSRESLRVRSEILGEEWEAWVLAENFARAQGLDLDYTAFRAARDRDIKSYARWMAE